MDVILVAPAAVDVNAAQRLEVGLALVDKVDRILVEPSLPALVNPLTALEIERQAEPQRRAWVGIVSRRHAQVHDRVAFAERKLFLRPDMFQKALDAAVVEPFGKTLAGAFAQGIVFSGLPLCSAESGQLRQRVGPVVPVDKIEVGIARMIGNRSPMLRVFHTVDDGPVSTRGLAETPAMVARREGPEFAIDEGDQPAD